VAKTYLKRYKALLVVGIAFLLIFLAVSLGSDPAEARTFHTEAERQLLNQMLLTQPYDTNTYFATGGRCGGCHGHDSAGFAMVTAAGEDVNILDDWAGTMMANAAKDPFWRAKVNHEILVNPSHQVDIEDKCTRCHAPTGRFEAHYLGQPNYSMASLATDTFGLDGVNCSACHQQKDSLMGTNFSGDLQYEMKHVYGPYEDIVSAVMEFFVGFTPSYGAHVTKSEFCGGCHSLLTETVDLSGNYTGGQFIEQATYHEWKNSWYSDTLTGNRTCQNCHIPRIDEPIDLATNYPFIPGRQPFGKHHLVGGNAFMIDLMRNNMSAIGATCEPRNFDTTFARSTRYLRDSTLTMYVSQSARTLDTVFYDVQLINKCGHKFPSGYPARIAWVEFVVTDLNNDTIFASGLHDVNGNVIGRDATFESHYNVINDVTQVQIYEMVMGDVVNNPTTVLERADTCLKDNRLVPRGFTTSHASYDTTQIVGIGIDPDFNYTGSTEGTGEDVVHFHVPLAGYAGMLNISSRVYYSSVPAAWLTEMFSYNSTQIDTFQSMFANADHTPKLVAEVIFQNTITAADQQQGHPEISIYPNPSRDGHLQITGWKPQTLIAAHVYDLSGKEVLSAIPAAQFTGTIDLPRRGVFLLVLETTQGNVVRKVVW
jgi:Cytochrome c554 and c-prime